MSDFYSKIIGWINNTRILSLLIVMMVMVQISGCGYRFAGSAGNRLSSTDSVWVAFPYNESAYSTAQTVLRRALLDELHAMRGIMPAASKEEADIQVSGSIRAYGPIRATAYTAIDQVGEFRAIVTVNLEVKRKGDLKPFWKGDLMATQDYPANIDLALQRNAEEAALAAASKKIGEKLITAVENSY